MLNSWQKSLIFVLLVSSSSYGSQTCNVHNLVFGPLLECGMKWWQDYDLAVEIDSEVTDKLSDVIETLLTYFGVSVDTEINSYLEGNINATTDDPFAKIVESALTIEPYPLFVAADLVLSLGFSAPILNEIGINGELGTRDGLLKMIGEYIDFGCSETYGMKAFVTCVKPKINAMCDEAEDKHSVIIDLIENAQDAYCDGTKAKQSVVDEFSEDLGTLFRPIFEDFLGFKVDFNNPEVIDYDDSIVYETAKLNKMETVVTEKCGAFINLVMDEMEQPNYLSDESTIGAGIVLDEFRKMAYHFADCVVRRLNENFDDIFSKAMLSHINLMTNRFGLPAITGDKIALGSKVRNTVAAFGDPHILSYRGLGVVETCEALGWHKYMENEYFKLQAYGEHASEDGDSEATYITAMSLIFYTDDGNLVSWQSATGEKPSVSLRYDDKTGLKVAGGVNLEEKGNGVVFTHNSSATSLRVQKYNETYLFVLRTASGLLDATTGLLITGCPNPTVIAAKRKKRSTEDCENACSGTNSLYQDACVFDCQVTGDTGVAETFNDVEDMQSDIENDDDSILKDFNGVPEGEDSGADKPTTMLTFVMMLAAVAAIFS